MPTAWLSWVDWLSVLPSNLRGWVRTERSTAKGQGAAPSYAMSLSEASRSALRERIRAGLPFAVDGSIPLMARAWAVRGVC